MPLLFRDRSDAGRRLAAVLQEFADEPDVLVLALPRGGVPVGYEVARALNVPLDVFVVRKLGAPQQRELAMGAIASGGAQILNQDVIRALGISPQQIEATALHEQIELERREELYRGTRGPVSARQKTVILVDDGLATGSTMRVAIAALRREGSREIVAAVPVAARSTCEMIAREADRAVCLYTPFDFYAVGQWYENFSQTSDEDVREWLAQSTKSTGQPAV